MANALTIAACSEEAAGTVDVITEVRREEALLKTGALQNAIFTSANFSSIATDEKGVIQLFDVGATVEAGVPKELFPCVLSDSSRSAANTP